MCGGRGVCLTPSGCGVAGTGATSNSARWRCSTRGSGGPRTSSTATASCSCRVTSPSAPSRRTRGSGRTTASAAAARTALRCAMRGALRGSPTSTTPSARPPLHTLPSPNPANCPCLGPRVPAISRASYPAAVKPIATTLVNPKNRKKPIPVSSRPCALALIPAACVTPRLPNSAGPCVDITRQAKCVYPRDWSRLPRQVQPSAQERRGGLELWEVEYFQNKGITLCKTPVNLLTGRPDALWSRPT
eukprot:1195144-Prorocentrum_minimum.AAC.6